MNNRVKLIACATVAVLTIAVAAPMTAQAVTLTIHNENCTKLKWFKQVKKVTVHVKGNKVGCTETSVTVKQGSQKTIWLEPYGDYGNECKYKHEAKTTVYRKFDVLGTEHASLTCKKNSEGLCRCRKD